MDGNLAPAYRRELRAQFLLILGLPPGRQNSYFFNQNISDNTKILKFCNESVIQVGSSLHTGVRLNIKLLSLKCRRYVYPFTGQVRPKHHYKYMAGDGHCLLSVLLILGPFAPCCEPATRTVASCYKHTLCRIGY